MTALARPQVFLGISYLPVAGRSLTGLEQQAGAEWPDNRRSGHQLPRARVRDPRVQASRLVDYPSPGRVAATKRLFPEGLH
jgi:hypothetical protein